MNAGEGARRYRDKECDICNQILPASEMRKVSVNRRTGHTQGGSRRFGSRSSSSSINYGARYRVVEYVVCPECPDPKSEGGFFGSIIIALIGLGVGGALLASSTGLFRAGVDVPTEAAARQGNDDPISLLPAVAEPAPGETSTQLETSVPANVVQPEDAGGHMAEMTSTLAGSPEEMATAASVFEEHAQALADATEKALASGKAASWKDGSVKGYVVPSEAIGELGATCRNLYAVATVDGVTTESAIQKLCETDGTWQGSSVFRSNDVTP